MYLRLRFLEEIVEAVSVPQERISERIAEQIVDAPTHQILKEIVEAIAVPQERISERIAEQIVDVPTPQILKEIVEAISVPQERISERIPEQIVDVPTPQILCKKKKRTRKRERIRPCDHAATGPSASNCCEDSGSPIDAVHRQFCGRPCDLAATGPLDSNCGEDGGSPACAVVDAAEKFDLVDLVRMMRDVNKTLLSSKGLDV